MGYILATILIIIVRAVFDKTNLFFNFFLVAASPKFKGIIKMK